MTATRLPPFIPDDSSKAAKPAKPSLRHGSALEGKSGGISIAIAYTTQGELALLASVLMGESYWRRYQR